MKSRPLCFHSPRLHTFSLVDICIRNCSEISYSGGRWRVEHSFNPRPSSREDTRRQRQEHVFSAQHERRRRVPLGQGRPSRKALDPAQPSADHQTEHHGGKETRHETSAGSDCHSRAGCQRDEACLSKIFRAWMWVTSVDQLRMNLNTY